MIDGGLTPDMGLNPHLVRPLSGFTLLISQLSERWGCSSSVDQVAGLGLKVIIVNKTQALLFFFF